MAKDRIVIIDDDETVTTLLEAILETAGYEVCTALNSVQANQYIYGPVKPALIILDVMMPFLSGEAVAGIFKNNEHTRSIPILFVSGKSEVELRALVAETGAAGFISKPFVSKNVIRTVQEVLGKGQGC